MSNSKDQATRDQGSRALDSDPGRIPRSADPLGFAQRLAPRIRELSADAEAAGRLPEEITDALRDEGIYSLMVPTAIGGGTESGQARPSLLMDVIEELAAADGSTGWAVMAQMTGIGTLLAILPDEGVDMVLQSEDYRTAGQIPPVGSAVRVDGGYRISGRFGFASGSSTAGWLAGGFIIKDENGEAELNENGERQVLVGLIPRSKSELQGGWDVLGLVATESVDYEFPEQELPSSLVATGKVFRGDVLHHAGVRLLTTLGHAAVAHGIMRASLNEFAKLAHARFRPPTGLLASHESVQRDFASWWAKARSARALTHEALNTIFDVVDQGGVATPAQEADCRLAATHAAHLVAEITQAVYVASGSDGLRNAPGNVIQRCFRDAHAVSQHILTGQHVYIEAGRIYLDTPGMNETHRRILDHVFAPPLSK